MLPPRLSLGYLSSADSRREYPSTALTTYGDAGAPADPAAPADAAAPAGNAAAGRTGTLTPAYHPIGFDDTG